MPMITILLPQHVIQVRCHSTSSSRFCYKFLKGGVLLTNYNLSILPIPFCIANRTGFADRNASILVFIASSHPNESRAVSICILPWTITHLMIAKDLRIPLDVRTFLQHGNESEIKLNPSKCTDQTDLYGLIRSRIKHHLNRASAICLHLQSYHYVSFYICFYLPCSAVL